MIKCNSVSVFTGEVCLITCIHWLAGTLHDAVGTLFICVFIMAGVIDLVRECEPALRSTFGGIL